MKKSLSHILVVDDDNRIRDLLSKYLKDNGFLVTSAYDAKDARLILNNFQIDLIILDVMMPEESGVEFTRYLRQNNGNNIPIIMLTALGESENKIIGLENGADDYIVKPFEPRELILRVEKLLTRFKVLAKKDTIKEFGKMQFDMDNNRLSCEGKIIALTSGETKLLSILIANTGNPISREKLAELCGNVNERSIDVQIIRLRNKIENDPKKPFHIQTIRGEGYVLYP